MVSFKTTRPVGFRPESLLTDPLAINTHPRICKREGRPSARTGWALPCLTSGTELIDTSTSTCKNYILHGKQKSSVLFSVLRFLFSFLSSYPLVCLLLGFHSVLLSVSSRKNLVFHVKEKSLMLFFCLVLTFFLTIHLPTHLSLALLGFPPVQGSFWPPSVLDLWL